MPASISMAAAALQHPAALLNPQPLRQAIGSLLGLFRSLGLGCGPLAFGGRPIALHLRLAAIASALSVAPSQDFPIERADLVRYAGASGDFNIIHWNERVAKEVGLPNVIAHGMLTMATAVRVVTDWVGDPAAVVDYSVRFTRPVVVPDPGRAVLTVAGEVKSVRDDGLLEVALTATVDGETVLA